MILVEAIHPFSQVTAVPGSPAAHLASGLILGIGIGLVSSILGVAGGELFIPTLMFVFGASIKAAGTASIVISLGVVLAGIWRYWRLGAIPSGRGVQRITGAMSAGSIFGAALGGLAVAYAPVLFLKAMLGVALLAAAAKILNHEP
jgi:uncharacterized membrane protein YfcA